MIICSDFDGTIAQNDVGSLISTKFGDPAACAKFVSAWKRDEISSHQCLEQELATVRVTPPQLEAFCEAQSLSPGFVEFARMCRGHQWPLIVLSDGLDYYIKRILARHDLDLPVFSNCLRFVAPDRLAADFPYLEHSCGRCGNCKGYHVRRLRRELETMVYIGDGFSDRCGAQEADMIFAKRDLAQWLGESSKTFYRFENFFEVANGLNIRWK
jgi:2,3-diketo-5-methylthio-1-phosphopentane phosphatase